MAVWTGYWQLNCAKCSDSLKIINGCETDTAIPGRWVVRDMGWKRCPLKMITPATQRFIQAHKYYKLGIMPSHLGWKKQANKLIEAIEVIDRESQLIESKIMRESSNAGRK